MAIYALWNNKGGVGKSYLTFQIASEYARTHPRQRVLVIDLCPQANASSMLLGGIEIGERILDGLIAATPKLTISGYIEERISSPYQSPRSGARYVISIHTQNTRVPNNLFLVVGDEELEAQTSRVSNATVPGPLDAWRIVHAWISDLIADIKMSWNIDECTVFIDCNPSFTIYTELAMAASDQLIIPFSADGSSRRAVRSVLALLYGITRHPGAPVSDFYTNTQRFRMSTPRIYSYVGNRLTQSSLRAASAYSSVVQEIGNEIWNVWSSHPNLFTIHPAGAPPPRSKSEFRRMFQAEINDANTASVVSGALGIPISILTAGPKALLGKNPMVNQSQLNKQQPNIQNFVSAIQ